MNTRLSVACWIFSLDIHRCAVCELNLVHVRILWVFFVRTTKQSSGSSPSPSVQPVVLCGSEHAESSRKGTCGLCRIWKPAKHHFIADFMYFS